MRGLWGYDVGDGAGGGKLSKKQLVACPAKKFPSIIHSIVLLQFVVGPWFVRSQRMGRANRYWSYWIKHIILL